MRTIIKNGTVVTASDQTRADVWIEDETIQAVAHPSLRAAFRADKEIDAAGSYVIPGGIDVHTHLDMPFMGTVARDDFATGTIAAAHGGTTTVVDFATQARGSSLAAGLQTWHAKAEGKAAIDYGFHMIMSDVNAASLDEMASLVREGVTSYKLFTAYPGRALQRRRPDPPQRMQRARDLGALVSLHAENGIAINVLIEQAVARGETAPKYHALTRPEVCEAEATHRSLCLAEMAGAPVYMVHLTAARALAELVRFRDRGLPAYGETCPQYLYCSLDDIGARAGSRGRSSSAARRCATRRCGRTCGEASSSDTCRSWPPTTAPSLRRDRRSGPGGLHQDPNGMPGDRDAPAPDVGRGRPDGQVRRPASWRWSPRRRQRSSASTRKKGTFAAGADADVVVWDPEPSSARARDAAHAGRLLALRGARRGRPPATCCRAAR